MHHLHTRAPQNGHFYGIKVTADDGGKMKWNGHVHKKCPLKKSGGCKSCFVVLNGLVTCRQCARVTESGKPPLRTAGTLEWTWTDASATVAKSAPSTPGGNDELLRRSLRQRASALYHLENLSGNMCDFLKSIYSVSELNECLDGAHCVSEPTDMPEIDALLHSTRGQLDEEYDPSDALIRPMDWFILLMTTDKQLVESIDAYRICLRTALSKQLPPIDHKTAPSASKQV